MAQIVTPVGRLIQGSVYRASTTDMSGKPLVYNSGPNIGQPRVEFYVALAIPKGPETHWNQTEWGKVIWEVGASSHPIGQHNRPDFAWKIVDGDSTAYNRATPPVRWCDKEGYPGHWVLSFKSGVAPQVTDRNGKKNIDQPEAIKTGYYSQIVAEVEPNNRTDSPGVYLKHRAVTLAGYGDVIVTELDTESLGLGQAPLPAGASLTPVGGISTTPAAASPVPTTAPPTVVPHTAILTPAPAPVPPAFTPPKTVAPVMTAKANGATYEQFIAQGWTHELLVQHGYVA